MYLMIFLFIFMLFIFCIFMLMNFIFSNFYMMNEREKFTSFECGFDLMSNFRLPFSIHFYLISILFLVFDVEIVLLFPMVNSINLLNYFNWFFISVILLMILYLGLEYEFKFGMLKWIL